MSKQRRAKFRVGQTVFVAQVRQFGKIVGYEQDKSFPVINPWHVRFEFYGKMTDASGFYATSSMRPLTAREKGSK